LTRASTSRQIFGLLGWLLLSFSAAAIGALASAQASEFYAQLTRPAWAPPPWLFAPVWTGLYLLMSVSAWLVWRTHGFREGRTALTLFIVLGVAALNAAVNVALNWVLIPRLDLDGAALAAGAPVSAHWVADRQSGPLLLRFGTEEQRQRFLPRIARGELAFAIGMSEPDSGSDLASVRTRAEKVAGGYKVNGTKIWTSNAHLSDFAIALFRTTVVPDKKHEGLSQFLVDLKSPGISIRPIYDLAGGHHFNEVHFQDCLVPDDMLVGKDGEGWKQVTTELGFERSGPERYLSSLQLVIELIREVGKEPPERAAALIGHFTAHLVTLRQMSLSIATMLQAGQNPNLEAAVMKDIGTTFEQEIPEAVHALTGAEPRIGSGTEFEKTLGYLIQHAPSFSLRGGTREVLRGIIARGLGLR